MVVGDRDGELTAIDLRDDLTLVEYSRPREDHRWTVLAVLVVLNALDVVTTMAVIAAGGHENNPLMRPLVDGVWPVILAKSVALGIVGLLLARCVRSRRVEVMMALATGWYLAVVCWNVAVLAVG